jgi:hypothetical protein
LAIPIRSLSRRLLDLGFDHSLQEWPRQQSDSMQIGHVQQDNGPIPAAVHVIQRSTLWQSLPPRLQLIAQRLGYIP